MQLSQNYITSPHGGAMAGNIFHLPEKVLQFGTGALLRGLCDFYIHKANQRGIFNGRVVVVKSTNGGTDEFARQNCLYTHVIRGIEDGQAVDKPMVNASISRVLPASTEWQQILACASNPLMRLIISNTTEAGLVFTEDDVSARPPASFPGKLLSFLFRRYQAFYQSEKGGVVIVPTELVVGNGDKLRDILVALARSNNMPEAFIEWVTTANHFCNSLVDRIVPGKPAPGVQTTMEEKLGYTDRLMITSEPYGLWAIECATPEVGEVLSFSAADRGVVLTRDMAKYRELKLRILNGAHTFGCGLALLCGFETVQQAMAEKAFLRYMQKLMLEEIAPGIVSGTVTYKDAKTFAANVIDRFRNPFIEHRWLGIAMQYSLKMFTRNMPNVLNWYKHNHAAPNYITLGFAAYLRFMHIHKNGDGRLAGYCCGKEYLVDDDRAEILFAHYTHGRNGAFVCQVLGDERLWGMDLNSLPGFAEAVSGDLANIYDCLSHNKTLTPYIQSDCFESR